jgi:hypothetical protein
MRTQLIEIRGENEETLKVKWSIKVNLHKSKIKDQNEKGAEIQG